MSTHNRGSQDPQDTKSGMKSGIKAPLIFSAVLGLIGGFVAMITSTGGLNNPDKPLRIDIGLIAFGVFFIVSLLVVAMMQLAARDNPTHLSQGSGVNRSSEELHRASVARARERNRAAAAEKNQAEEADRRAAEQAGRADAQADQKNNISDDGDTGGNATSSSN